MWVVREWFSQSAEGVSGPRHHSVARVHEQERTMSQSNGSKSLGLLARLIIAAVGGAGLSATAGAQCTSFTGVSLSTGATIVPGTTSANNSGDDTVTSLALPFPVMLYGASYTTCNVSSNGNIQFGGTSNNAYNNICLPDTSMGVAILAHWDDLMTNTGTGSGIYTSISGTAPNRAFNIEWKAVYFSPQSSALDFEVRLFEDDTHFEIIYGAVPQSGSSATIGVQAGNATTYTSYSCNTGSLTAGSKLTFTCGNGPTSPQGLGSASPSSVYNCAGATALLTVAVNPGLNPTSTGLAVTGDLSAIGGSGTQTFYDDGTHGDAAAGDGTFSYSATIPAGISTGSKAVVFTVTDDQSRSTTGSFVVSVNPCPTLGPDVFVGRITDVVYEGNVGGPVSTGIYAYAIGTDGCNAGDTPVSWVQNSYTHPVIAQNFYRYKLVGGVGRFEQIGQSWAKHGFLSTNSPNCYSNCQQPPQGGAQLGVHCSDTYGAGLNGTQSYLGPRYQVNATTGSFPWPHITPPSTTIGGRLQCHWPDVDPAQNSGARYFAEGHYVTADDATYVDLTPPYSIHGNGLNNVTWNEINLSNPSASQIPLLGSSHSMEAAIGSWHAIDPGVVIANADYLDTNITARFIVGTKVTSNGNGTWAYEYAVFNQNADRSAGTFSVPLPPGAVVTNIGFHDVDYHSGEPYDGTDWTSSATSSGITWSTVPFATNTYANALRWGTMYNFRFTANVAPNAAGAATIGIFKPANSNSPATSVSAVVPSPTVPNCGTADFNMDGDMGTDTDIAAFFACLAGTCCPTCQSVDFNHDGDYGTDADIEAFFRVLSGGTC
jgi:hypothetical protein